MTNILKKVFNWSELHLSEMTCYKIHTSEQFWKQNTNFLPNFSKSNLVYLPFIFLVLIIVIFSDEFAFCSIFRIVQGVMPVLSLDQAVLNPGSVCTIIEKSSDIITNIVISSTIWQPIDP